MLSSILGQIKSRIAYREFSQRYLRHLSDPVIAHIHVPKCGGTAFRMFLIQQFGLAHLALYVPDTFYVYPEADLAALLSDHSVRGFSSHFVRTFPEKLAGRDMLYVTFLRNPIDQFISYITYVRKNFLNIQSDSTLIQSLPPDPTSMSVRDIAQWILTCHREVNFKENYTVNFFSRYALPGEIGPFRMDPYFLKHRLPVAKQLLKRFFFVGVSDQMNRSVKALRALLSRVDVDLPPREIPLENTSFDFRDDLSWIHHNDEVGSILLHAIREDQALYDFALARLALLEYLTELAA